MSSRSFFFGPVEFFEVGLKPISNGYGDFVPEITINIIANQMSWLSLNTCDLAGLFKVLRDKKEFFEIPGWCYSISDEDIMANVDGNFSIKFKDELYFITYTKEGDKSQIILSGDTIINLLKMQKMIDSKITNIRYDAPDISDNVEKLASKYQDNAYGIIEEGESWYSDDIVRELSSTFFAFFADFVKEVKNQRTSNEN